MKNIVLSGIALAGLFLFPTNSFAQSTPPAPLAPAKTATPPTPKKPASAVAWKETTHDFGEIKKGVPVTHDFTFVNTTNETILITNVKASCGCTATNYTKTPIKPGETGFVSAKYNAASTGNFSKTVTVTFNENEAPRVLTVKGKVLESENTVQQ
jgi:hypothetical protein